MYSSRAETERWWIPHTSERCRERRPGCCGPHRAADALRPRTTQWSPARRAQGSRPRGTQAQREGQVYAPILGRRPGASHRVKSSGLWVVLSQLRCCRRRRLRDNDCSVGDERRHLRLSRCQRPHRPDMTPPHAQRMAPSRPRRRHTRVGRAWGRLSRQGSGMAAAALLNSAAHAGDRAAATMSSATHLLHPHPSPASDTPQRSSPPLSPQ